MSGCIFSSTAVWPLSRYTLGMELITPVPCSQSTPSVRSKRNHVERFVCLLHNSKNCFFLSVWKHHSYFSRLSVLLLQYWQSLTSSASCAFNLQPSVWQQVYCSSSSSLPLQGEREDWKDWTQSVCWGCFTGALHPALLCEFNLNLMVYSNVAWDELISFTFHLGCGQIRRHWAVVNRCVKALHLVSPPSPLIKQYNAPKQNSLSDIIQNTVAH